MKNILSLCFLMLIYMFSGCSVPIEENISQFEVSEMIDGRDGQRYKTVKIGHQWWMAENLNYYTNSGSWYYQNDSLYYAETYGRLYLYETIMAGDKSSESNPSNVTGISPPGWHIPSEEEWKELQSYLAVNGYNVNDLKEEGTAHWGDQNAGTNALYFNMVPAGTIYNDGKNSANIRIRTVFLTCTEDRYVNGVRGVTFSHDSSKFMYAPIGKLNGWSLRCVKDKN